MTTAGPSSQSPGARFAMSIIHPGSPTLRVRFRQGILVTPQGYPDWPLCARALLELPPPEPGLTRDELRLVDVLAANAVMARGSELPDGDPLWAPAAPGRAVPTPPGWCWAHVALTRQLALVPIELHGSYRHAGGMHTLPVVGRGLRVDAPPAAVHRQPPEAVPEELLDLLERSLGWPLPPAYRRFLAETNGAGPASPAVLPGYGLVADQPLFGIARPDLHQDLSYVAEWVTDRLTPDFLPIGYVQGGLLAVKVSGSDLDSIWYWDDDDPRDRDGYDAEYICGQLLHRCADSIDEFWAALAEPARALVRLAQQWADADADADADAGAGAGAIRPVRDGVVGAGLPPRLRAAWQHPVPAGRDPLVAMFEAR